MPAITISQVDTIRIFDRTTAALQLDNVDVLVEGLAMGLADVDKQLAGKGASAAHVAIIGTGIVAGSTPAQFKA